MLTVRRRARECGFLLYEKEPHYLGRWRRLLCLGHFLCAFLSARINKGSSDVLNGLVCCLHVSQSSGTDATLCVLHTTKLSCDDVRSTLSSEQPEATAGRVQCCLSWEIIFPYRAILAIKKKILTKTTNSWHKGAQIFRKIRNHLKILGGARKLAWSSRRFCTKFGLHDDLLPAYLSPPVLTEPPGVVNTRLPNQSINAFFYGTRRFFTNGSYSEPLHPIPSPK